MSAQGGPSGQWWVRIANGTRFGPAGIDLVQQWAREGRVPADAMLESDDGGPPLRAADHPALRPLNAAPPTAPGPLTAPVTPDTAMGGLIPYKNVPALVGYYVAIFGGLTAILGPGLGAAVAGAAGRPGSGMGIVGFLVGVILGLGGPVTAVVLGFKGLKRYRQEPRCRGRTHAWVAIVGGILGGLLCLLLVLIMGAAVLAGP